MLSVIIMKIKFNIHRGVHFLSQQLLMPMRHLEKLFVSTSMLNTTGIIFTKGNTEAINLVANGFHKILQEGDEALKAYGTPPNIVPWQMALKCSAPLSYPNG